MNVKGPSTQRRKHSSSQPEVHRNEEFYKLIFSAQSSGVAALNEDSWAALAKQQFAPIDFEYLVGTTHKDPSDGLLYVSVDVRMYENLIVVDRVLSDKLGINTTNKNIMYDIAFLLQILHETIV